MMFKKLLRIRYVVLLAILTMFINSVFLIIGGTILSVKGYIEFIKNGFIPSETYKPGIYIMKGLDGFMLAIIFIIFGLGIARLFLFNSVSDEEIPSWLRFQDMKGLKVLLWETILVTLVIYCLQVLLTYKQLSLELLIIPGAILLLALALFFVRWKEKH
jgi:uncharacterized membrane protein YqhA